MSRLLLLFAIAATASSLVLRASAPTAAMAHRRPFTTTQPWLRPQPPRHRLNLTPIMRDEEKPSYLSSSVAAWTELAKDKPAAFALRVVILGGGLWFFATVALTLLQRAS